MVTTKRTNKGGTGLPSAVDWLTGTDRCGSPLPKIAQKKLHVLARWAREPPALEAFRRREEGPAARGSSACPRLHHLIDGCMLFPGSIVANDCENLGFIRVLCVLTMHVHGVKTICNATS